MELSKKQVEFLEYIKKNCVLENALPKGFDLRTLSSLLKRKLIEIKDGKIILTADSILLPNLPSNSEQKIDPSQFERIMIVICFARKEATLLGIRRLSVDKKCDYLSRKTFNVSINPDSMISGAEVALRLFKTDLYKFIGIKEVVDFQNVISELLHCVNGRLIYVKDNLVFWLYVSEIECIFDNSIE